MRKVERIAAALEAGFGPGCVVRDVSAAHAGHGGAPEGGESHFEVEVPSRAVEGLGRVARERAVHGALGGIMGEIHALQVRFV